MFFDIMMITTASAILVFVSNPLIRIDLQRCLFRLSMLTVVVGSLAHIAYVLLVVETRDVALWIQWLSIIVFFWSMLLSPLFFTMYMSSVLYRDKPKLPWILTLVAAPWVVLGAFLSSTPWTGLYVRFDRVSELFVQGPWFNVLPGLAAFYIILLFVLVLANRTRLEKGQHVPFLAIPLLILIYSFIMAVTEGPYSSYLFAIIAAASIAGATVENPARYIYYNYQILSRRSLKYTIIDLTRMQKPFGLAIWHLNTAALSHADVASDKQAQIQSFLGCLSNQFGQKNVFLHRHDMVVVKLSWKNKTSPPPCTEIQYFCANHFNNDQAERLIAQITHIPDYRMVSLLTLTETIQLAYDFVEEPSDRIVKCVDEKQAKRLIMLNQVIQRLPEIFEDGTLRLHYQPVLNRQTGQFDMAECLLRYHDETVGALDVGVVLKLIAREKMQHRLSQFVIEKVCQDLAKQRATLLGLKRIALNFSYQEIEDVRFERMVLETLKRYDLPPSIIGIELTEQEMGHSLETIEQAINTLRPYGFFFHLDDFGIGYSNLAFLIRTRFDVVKFDRSLLRMAVDQPKRQAFLAQIVTLFKNDALNLVIEGVGSEIELKTIETIPFDYIQGFHFAKPMPFDDFVTFMSKNNQETLQNQSTESHKKIIV